MPFGKHAAILESQSSESQVQRAKMPKFLCQRRKKRQFYGNRFTNNRRVNNEELEVEESTSSGSVAGLSHDGEEAKESSASFRKLQSTAQEEKPKPKLDEVQQREPVQPLQGLGSVIWRCYRLCFLSYDVANVAISVFCLQKII